MEEKQMVQIEGTVEVITFHNEENGFTVLELDRGDDLVTVVGEMLEVQAGERLVLHGSFTSHATYGYQFKVAAYERALPATAAAIEKYLASGAIKGIGPILANRLVSLFGDDTLEIMEKQPDQLCRVKGISPQKAKDIAQEFSRMYGIRMTMLFLSKYQIDSSKAIRIWKKWGDMAKDLIEQNPFLLCGEDIGMTFEECDAIASQLDIPREDPHRIRAALCFVLQHNLNNGHTCLPEDKLIPTVASLAEVSADLICRCEKELLQEEELYGCTVEERFYLYLPELYRAETYVASRIKTMLWGDGIGAKDYTKEIDLLEQETGLAYACRQREAIKEAMQHSVFILTGGPGTGKTTTINAILALLEKEGKKVGLTAPTGRAAKRMSEVSGRDAKTIHRLLEVDYRELGRTAFKHTEKDPLPYDAVIVDEVSMVDILLMQSLIRGLRMGTKLILVGDSDQLPSVGPGNVLRDLIDSGAVRTVQLTEIFRQAAESLIITNAHRIVGGEMPLLDQKDRDFFFMYRPNHQKLLSTVAELCSTRLPQTYGFVPLRDIQVIAPTRVGEAGTTQLNRALQETLNPPHPHKDEFTFEGRLFRQGDKVMQIKNNYDILWTRGEDEQGAGVYNGDIGILEMLDRPSRTAFVQYDDRLAEYSFDQLGELEHAYAVTVHKSQGSEFEAVVLPLMHYKSKLNFRNLLYTAVTRAKKLLIILGIPQTIQQMVENNRKTIRYTNLSTFLGEGNP